MQPLASLLPRSTREWTRLLQHALQIPQRQIIYPDHFYLSTAGRQYSVLPQRMSARSVLPVHNGVLVLLSPTATESEFQDMCITVTKRSLQLRHHTGEMSFPGGHIEKGESPAEAAQREALEETAVQPEEYTVVGSLQPIQSLSSSGVVAVVAVADQPVHPQCASPAEVDSIHYLHLSNLLTRSAETHCCAARMSKAANNHLLHFPCFFTSPSQSTVSPAVKASSGLERLDSDGGKDPLRVSDYPGELVWGLTALMLCEILARVATQIELEHPNEPVAKASSLLQCTNVVARPPVTESPC